MSDHVDDALAVVADAAWDEYLVVGWSLGVNIALELAAADQRVLGVLALAGLPGGSYDAILPVGSLPRDVASQLVTFSTALLESSGQWLGGLAQRIGDSPLTTELLQNTGAIGARANAAHVRELVRDFLGMDVQWYGRLAGALRRHEAMDLERVTCPVVYISAERDVITDPLAVEEAAGRTPAGSVQRWDGTHFLVLEYPDLVRETLLSLAVDVGLA